jgi:inorganic triphosphatase YgiF
MPAGAVHVVPRLEPSSDAPAGTTLRCLLGPLFRRYNASSLPHRVHGRGPLQSRPPASRHRCYARSVDTERELKFSTPGPLPVSEKELADALAREGFELGPPATVQNKDRYFDDARLSLSRAGLALRRRMSEGAMLATLKTRGSVEGALHDREEIELPMEGREWPKQILDRVATVAVPGLLQPHTLIETRRLRYAVLREGRPVAVLAFDQVTARSQHGERSVGFDEVEIEAHGHVDGQTLERIATAVGELVPLTASAVTKLERVRQLLMLGDWLA